MYATDVDQLRKKSNARVHLRKNCKNATSEVNAGEF
jgi:hypothetical protein